MMMKLFFLVSSFPDKSKKEMSILLGKLIELNYWKTIGNGLLMEEKVQLIYLLMVIDWIFDLGNKVSNGDLIGKDVRVYKGRAAAPLLPNIFFFLIILARPLNILPKLANAACNYYFAKIKPRFVRATA